MNNIEKANNNAIFTFIARGSMALVIPIAVLMWTGGVTLLNDRFAVLTDSVGGSATRVAIVETRVNDHEKRITQNEFQIQQDGKTLDAAVPVASATAAKLARDEDRLDAMAMAMADIRHGIQDMSTQIAALAIQLADLKARVMTDHHVESDVGVPGAMTTQIEPLAGVPKLP